MRKVIFGSVFCMSGIILYGMYLIATSIYSGYGAFKTRNFGEEMIGSFPPILAAILFIIGIIISINGFREREN